MNPSRIRFHILVFVLVALLTTACSTPTDSDTSTSEVSAAGESEKLQIVSTVSPVTNIVYNIGGEKIALTGIVPEGVNSHTFEPAPSDARALAEADLVFINGLNLEEPTLRLAEANIGDDAEIVLLGDMTITPDEHVFDFSFPAAAGSPESAPMAESNLCVALCRDCARQVE